MMHTEIHDHCIKGAIGKRQAFRIAFPKLEFWVALSGDRNHLCGKVEPNW